MMLIVILELQRLQNKVPTDIANKSAIITNIIDGGIKIPKVPDAAIVPVARDLSYFLSNITG